MLNEIYLISTIIGFILVMNGYHSIDLVYNSQNVNFDKTISGKILVLDDIYRIGWMQIFIGIIFIAVGCYNINKVK